MVNIKILIIGPVASGKTTLPKKIAKEKNLLHYEIDSIVHDDKNNLKRTLREQLEIINKINNQENWIIEGTLRKNLDILLELSEKIIYLDIPLKVRKRRIFTRFIKQKLHIEKSNYKLTLKIFKLMYFWTNEFENNKLVLENKLKKYHYKITKVDMLNTFKLLNIEI